MAKIVHSDAAPAEAVHYIFSGVEFDLGGSKAKSYETEDVDVLSNADAHPWLRVERDAVELVGGTYVEQLVTAPAINVNDPDEVRKAEAAKAEGDAPVVAIESGLDQTKVVTEGDVAETLAADPTSKTSTKVKG